MNQSHRRLESSTTIQLATHARALSGTKLNSWLGKRFWLGEEGFAAPNPGQTIENNYNRQTKSLK
jgi:hypothetical protein